MNHGIRNRIALPVQLILCFLATAFLLAQGDLPQQPQTSAKQPSSQNMTEDVLGELNVSGNSVFATLIFVSPDGNRVAWVQYPKTLPSSFVDGQPTGKGLGKVFVDGQPTPGEFYAVSGVAFSQDNKHVMFLGYRKAGVQSLIVDGKEVGTGVLAARFNANGQVVQLLRKEKKKVEVLVDGVQTTTLDLDQVDRLVSVGNSIAILGARKRNTFWVVNGIEGPAYEVIGNIVFSADGQHSAYAGANQMKNQTIGFLVVDGKQAEQKEALLSISGMTPGFRSWMDPLVYGVGDPIFSTDGSRIAYAACRDLVAMFVDGKAGPSFDNVWTVPVFTTDGKHHGYVASTGNTWQVVLDHKVIREIPLPKVNDKSWAPKMNFSDGLVLSPDGARTAFIAGKGGEHFFSFGGGSRVPSEDGTPARRRVVLDDKQLEEHDCFYLSDLQFSSDSRHAVYAVHGATDKAAHIVVDGQDGKIHQQIAPGSVKFVDEHTVTYVARNDTKLVRVTWKLD
jgi:hypothetical protein